MPGRKIQKAGIPGSLADSEAGAGEAAYRMEVKNKKEQQELWTETRLSGSLIPASAA